MDLLKLDVVQCPNEYYVQNPFKDTHRCDRKTSYVSSSLLMIDIITLRCFGVWKMQNIVEKVYLETYFINSKDSNVFFSEF